MSDVGVKVSLVSVREETKLREFENKVLGRMLGHRGEKIKRGRRKLHNENFHNLYPSVNI